MVTIIDVTGETGKLEHAARPPARHAGGRAAGRAARSRRWRRSATATSSPRNSPATAPGSGTRTATSWCRSSRATITLHIITEDGLETHELRAGMLVVVPQGAWHRFRSARTASALMTATPKPTEHLTVDVADPRTLERRRARRATSKRSGAEMYFDRRLWELTRGLRGRIALAILLGPAGRRLRHRPLRAPRRAARARLRRRRARAPSRCWRPAVAGAVLLRGAARPCAHGDRAPAPRAGCRRSCAAGSTTRSPHSGPAWFAGERTGGVMLSMVDGVEQLQSFFGQYLPQVCGRRADARWRSSPSSCCGTCRSPR